MARKKTPPEVFERQEQNIRRMRELLQKALAEEDQLRAAKDKESEGKAEGSTRIEGR